MATDNKTLIARGPSSSSGSFAGLGAALAGGEPGGDGAGRPTTDGGRQAASPVDARAFAERIDDLFRTQAPRLLRFLRRRTRGHEDAADLLQEAFVRLIRSVSHEAFPESPEAYLQQIAGNLLRDRSRRQASHSEASHEPLDEQSIDDGAPSPVDLLEAQELLKTYETALLKLRPKTREIFLLHRQEGLTYGQIASETGLSVSGVEKHMMKAIAHIDSALGRL